MLQVYESGTDAARPSLTTDQVADAYPWPQRGPWVRAMMVTTLDGSAVGPDGLSGSVSSPEDQAVFTAVRRYADAVLVGAETLRAERYTPMVAKPADAAHRAQAGQNAAPVVAVVSASLDLPWSLPLWTQSTHRPLVLTGEGGDPTRVATALAHAEVLALPQITPQAIVTALTDRGLPRILCEGGPRLLHDFVAADLLDEADITLSPMFTGTSRTPLTETLPESARFDLVQVLHEKGVLMTRYLAPRR